MWTRQGESSREMPGSRSVRGDVNAILNRMIRDGVITSFETNFDTLSVALAPHVKVTANMVTLAGKEGYDPEGVMRLRKDIMRKLEPLAPGVIVSVRETPSPALPREL